MKNMSATETREHPILFNDEMVRAILEGRKTQTRRPVRRQPFKDEEGHWCVAHERGIGRTSIRVDEIDPKTGGTLSQSWEGPERVIRATQKCPFGSPGDRLWVRECFCARANQDGIVTGEEGYWYRASDAHLGITKSDDDGGIQLRQDGSEASPWIPSIHMPRWASRLTLEVKAVRVEMAQEISRWDIDAEGCPFRCESDDGDPMRQLAWFVRSWDSIYSPKGLGWDANPWVWVVEFERVKS